MEELKSRIKIEDVLLENGIYLKRGRCRCPLHNGDNPTSFSVSRDGRYFQCFACGAKGSAVDLVMSLYSLDLKEAIRWLSEKTGLKVERSVLQRIPCRKKRRRLTGAELKLQIVEIQRDICKRKLQHIRKKMKEGKLSKGEYEYETQKIDLMLEGMDGVCPGLDELACWYAFEAKRSRCTGDDNGRKRDGSNMSIGR
ncbi:MAG: CHC2 zinc finger domain-containing protein [Candidatus Zixiibacteriota bacterium]